MLPPALLRTLGRPAAVFFHGVEREIHDPELQSNHHRIEDFWAIAWALRQDFDVAPLSALGEVLRQPQRHRRTIFLMSDDGYANTLTVAADLCTPKGCHGRCSSALSTSTPPNAIRCSWPAYFLRHAPDGTYRD